MRPDRVGPQLAGAAGHPPGHEPDSDPADPGRDHASRGFALYRCEGRDSCRRVEFHVGRSQDEEITATITRLMLTGAAPAAAQAPPASVADELVKLAQLRDVGALTDEEFAAQKARLLGTQGNAGPEAGSGGSVWRQPTGETP